MFLVTANQQDKLLFINYAGNVRLDELVRRREYIKKIVTELSPGFRVLADFANFESMEPECLAEMGQVMEVFAKNGVAMSVRVIPDSRRDPGVNILTAFHYKGKKAKDIKVVTCKNLVEAGKALGL